MTLRLRLLPAAVAATLLLACGTPPEYKFSEIRTSILPISCSLSDSCHNAVGLKGGLDLKTDPYASLVGVDPVKPAAKLRGWKRVVAGDETKSFFYQKLLPATDPDLGSRMPSPLQPLSASDIAQIRNWIKRGAPND